jgi:predicted metalloprotease
MRWKGERQSDNVEDQRGAPTGRVVAVGGGLGTLAFFLIAVLLGADPQKLLQLLGNNPQVAGPQAPGGQGPQGGGPPQQGNPAEDERAEFVGVVLKDTEDVWDELFREMGKEYQKPKLVLFTDNIRSDCGFASSAVGPFYCPADSKVYIDLTFYDELKRRFKAPGDFAQAYVIAHEVGHHVQNLLGTSRKFEIARQRASEAEANALSVRMELQADFLAGVWAHHAQRMKNILEAGDIESGLRAASAIGDDKIQMQSRGYVVPDSFTHGSSDQRVRWFSKGFKTGDIRQGNTFEAEQL